MSTMIGAIPSRVIPATITSISLLAIRSDASSQSQAQSNPLLQDASEYLYMLIFAYSSDLCFIPDDVIPPRMTRS